MKFKVSFIIAVFILILTSSVFAAINGENRRLIEMNMDPTYIAFPINIDEENDNRFKHLFESELNLPLHWFDFPKEEYDWGLSGFFIVNAKINLRMYWQNSQPIKTPNFMPQGIYYFWFDPVNDFISGWFKIFYISAMISHFSNGQSGNFYTSQGEVNTESGNFSTNYLEFAANFVTRSFLWLHLAYRWHPGFNREPELDDQYETEKVLFGVRQFLFFDKLDLQIFATVSYITGGRKYIQAPEQATGRHPAIAGVKAKKRDNFNYQLQFHLKPHIFEDVSFFLKYDYGYDYYNINFQEKINRIEIGFSGYVNRKCTEQKVSD